MTEWPEPVQRVSDYLRQAGAEARLEEFADGARTAKDAAQVIGCELGQIVKSLVFVCDGRSVLVLVPGDRRADPAKVAAALSAAEARTAAPDEVAEATGFAPGGVAPFALPHVERVLMERTLLAHDVVWVGAGSTQHMAGLAPTELVRLARASTMDAVQEGT